MGVDSKVTKSQGSPRNCLEEEIIMKSIDSAKSLEPPAWQWDVVAGSVAGDPLWPVAP